MLKLQIVALTFSGRQNTKLNSVLKCLTASLDLSIQQTKDWYVLVEKTVGFESHKYLIYFVKC